ncbi:AAA+ family ATPase [Tabrizicola piscis]|jgi:hypothetical protein|uniref:AAA+ family ATPase n=2 Tax=Tabrizicola piscis TaxID=2494374 RepID=A0A3S8U4J5_9RHOB|nr:AAA+ family ATPase [Tabrizicola piscis]
MQGTSPHIDDMKLALALCLVAAPAFAQDTAPTPAPPAEEDEGFSLMEEGAKLVLRGLLSEMEPAIDEMEKALTEIGPALEGLGEEVGPKLRQLIALIDDFKNYDAPVMLPNGDIIIRRNAPLVPKPEFAPGPNGEIDL